MLASDGDAVEQLGCQPPDIARFRRQRILPPDLCDGARYRNQIGRSCQQDPLFKRKVPQFGIVFERSGNKMLARYEHHHIIRRILELGCGLALSSLMLARRGADITASDNHPLAEQFLAYNAGLNQLPMPVYRDLPWLDSGAELGQFDLILGSDILYEREHAAILAALLQRMSTATAEIIISDPGRGNGGRLITALAAVGFGVIETRMAFSADDSAPFKGRLLHFRRPAVC